MINSSYHAFCGFIKIIMMICGVYGETGYNDVRQCRRVKQRICLLLVKDFYGKIVVSTIK